MDYNTISNSSHGISCGEPHAAFDNIIITGMSSTDIRSQDVKLEFFNTQFSKSMEKLCF